MAEPQLSPEAPASPESGTAVDRALSEGDRLAAELARTELALIEAEQRCRRTEDRVSELERAMRAPVIRIALRAHQVTRRVFPQGTRRGRSVSLVGRGIATLVEQGPRGVTLRLRERAGARRGLASHGLPWDHDAEYARWRHLHEPDAGRLEAMSEELRSWDDRPLVSIIMPAYESPPVWLEEAIGSVVAQVYDRWELCVADDASPSAYVGEALAKWEALDPRIRHVRRERNGGIAAASNTALGMARGELVAFLDHDDVLRPHALYAAVSHLRDRPDTGLVYSDEDKLRPDGSPGNPFFKPDWSPELFLASNYLNHLTVIRRDLVDAVGRFRLGYEGSQDYDLFLRVVETGCVVGHVPEVLYAWRMALGSAALSADAKPYAYQAAERALQAALDRRGGGGHIEPGASLGWYHARYPIVDTPRVTIVIPTRDRLDLLRTCIASIDTRSTWQDREILIVDNGSVEPDTLAYLRATPHRVLAHPGPFNYSQIINAAVSACGTDFVLLLNNDVEVITPGWIEALLELAQLPSIGAVGCRLVRPDGSVAHEGIAVGYGDDLAVNVNYGGWYGLGDAIRNVSAVTGACMLVRRSTFAEVGGFDEALRVAYNDVDFCLRLRERGYRNAYTPRATLVHAESSTRGKLHPAVDEEAFRRRWVDGDGLSDPYLNPAIRALNPLRLCLDGRHRPGAPRARATT